MNIKVIMDKIEEYGNAVASYMGTKAGRLLKEIKEDIEEIVANDNYDKGYEEGYEAGFGDGRQKENSNYRMEE